MNFIWAASFSKSMADLILGIKMILLKLKIILVCKFYLLITQITPTQVYCDGVKICRMEITDE